MKFPIKKDFKSNLTFFLMSEDFINNNYFHMIALSILKK